jgi:hypothetical protein
VLKANEPILAVHTHTKIPVPKVLAWDSDPSNPVGAEYIIMEKAPGVQLFNVWDDMSDDDQLSIVKRLSELEGELTRISFPANGSLYLRTSMADNDAHIALDHDMDPNGRFCIGPSCERGLDLDKTKSLRSQINTGPYKRNRTEPLS